MKEYTGKENEVKDLGRESIGSSEFTARPYR
jgi:hypothetical protein